MAESLARWRRKYRKGNCDDCGRFRNVTRVTFWLNGMKYVVCAECIKPYRGVITTKNTDTDIYQRAEA